MLIISSIIVVICLISIAFTRGIVSIESALSLVLFYPTFAPSYARLLGADQFTLQNPVLQESTSLLGMAALTMAAAAIVYTVVLVLFSRSIGGSGVSRVSQRTFEFVNPLNRSAMISLYIALLVFIGFFGWLTEPGPTIFQASYSELRAARIPGTQFAGALFLFSWSFALLLVYRCENINKNHLFVFLFWLVTAATIIWLLAHARRSEVAGLSIVIIALFHYHFGIQRALLVLAVLVFLMVFAGVSRNLLASGGDLSAILQHSVLLGGEGNVRKLPGGAGNVYMTFVASMDMNETGKSALLLGRSYADYIIHLIPTNLERFFDLTAPPRYNKLIDVHYDYGGGLYVFSVSYGNFWVAGVLGLSVVLGAVVAFAAQAWRSGGFFQTLLGVLLIVSFFRTAWYSPIMTFKLVILGLAVALVWKLAKAAATA